MSIKLRGSLFMKWSRRTGLFAVMIALTVGAAMFTGGTVPASASAQSTTAPALASTPPPTKVQANLTGWAGMSVKPRNIYFGQGGAPYITNLAWSYWHNGANARAAGRLHVQANPKCHPSYRCPYTTRYVSVYLDTMKTHGSLHYFYNMAVRFYHAGAWHRLVGAFKPLPGATAPFWIFPAVWPYL
jgi:hypothetical protein